MRNYKFLFVILLLFVSFIYLGCRKEEKIDVDYFNNNMNISEYKSYDYKRVVELEGVLLLEEVTQSEFNGSEYYIATETKKLNSDGSYDVDSLVTTLTKEEQKVRLELKEEDFENFEIKDTTIEIKVLDEKSQSVIGVDAKNVKIKVTLVDKKLTFASISYIDIESGFNVSIQIEYKY